MRSERLCLLLSLLLSVTLQAKCGSEAEWCQAINSPNVSSIELVLASSNVVPSLETSYICQTFTIPADQDYHIIAFEPIIENVDLVNHIVLFVCDTVTSKALISSSSSYTAPSQCGLAPPECPNPVYEWALGAKGMCFGNDYGLLMGKSTYAHVIVQIHYANPSKKQIEDSSGLKLYYTSKLRGFDTGLIRPSQRDIAIPPGSDSTKIVGRAFQSVSCSEDRLFPYVYYNITSVRFNMHQKGYQANLILERKNSSGLVEKFILADESFDYAHQKAYVFDPEVVMQPGDGLVIECFYNTKSAKTWTFFGKSTDDESCFADVNIYPKPREMNYLEVGSWGLNDFCGVRENGVPNLCKKEVLDGIILSMKWDTISLWVVCGPLLSSDSTDCCAYLARHKFLSYQCIYTAAYELVRQLIEPSKPADVNLVHSNILRCISAVQTISLEELNAGGSTIRSVTNGSLSFTAMIFLHKVLRFLTGL